MFLNIFNYKRTVFCFLFLLIFLNNKAQDKEEITISGTYQNVSVISFLNELEKKYSLTFYYNPEWFQHDTVNLFFNNTPLSEALQRAIKGKSVVQLRNSFAKWPGLFR